MQAMQFLEWLETAGYNFFTGVPCSYLKTFTRILGEKKGEFIFPAPREDIALALAAGAYMAGKKPVVYMQNSGLGYCLEVVASLNLIYAIPALVLLTNRGPQDPNWEEHQVMGEHTGGILKEFFLPFMQFTRIDSPKRLEEIGEEMNRSKKPYFLLIEKEDLI